MEILLGGNMSSKKWASTAEFRIFYEQEVKKVYRLAL